MAQSHQSDRDAAADRIWPNEMHAAAAEQIMTAETQWDTQPDAIADLVHKLDELGARLHARGAADSDDMRLKSALRAVEAELQNFVRRRAASTALDKTAAISKSELKSASQAAFPIGSDLLHHLSLAMPRAASAGQGGRNDLAELARKLDEMCSGATPFRAHEAAGDAGTARQNEQAPARSEARTTMETHAKAFEPGARHAETNPGPGVNSGDGAAQASPVATAEPHVAPAAESAQTNPLGSPQSEQHEYPQVFDSETISHRSHNSMQIKSAPGDPPHGGANSDHGLGDAASEILARLMDPDRAAAFREMESRLDVTAAKEAIADAVFAAADEPRSNEGLLDQIEAAERRLAARFESGLAAAMAETSAMKDMVGALSAKMEAAHSPSSASPEIEALKQEIARVVARIDHADQAFASQSFVENSLAGIVKRLEETRRTTLDAVAAAEGSGTPHFAALTGSGDSDARAGEIAELRAALDAADRRVDLTLTALRETVDKVADRLVKVEADIGAMRPPRLGSFLAPNLTPIFAQRGERLPAESDAMEDAASTPGYAPHAPFSRARPAFATKPRDEAKSSDASDILLEPGSGLPHRAKMGEPPEPGAPSEFTNPPDSETPARSDFIAAARRAAQAAQPDLPDPETGGSNAEASPDLEPRPGFLDHTRRLFGAHKPLVILSLAILTLAAGAYALARKTVQTASIEELAPKLARQLEKALLHGKAQGPAAVGAAAGGDLPAAGQPQAGPGPHDQTDIGPRRSEVTHGIDAHKFGRITQTRSCDLGELDCVGKPGLAYPHTAIYSSLLAPEQSPKAASFGPAQLDDESFAFSGSAIAGSVPIMAAALEGHDDPRRYAAPIGGAARASRPGEDLRELAEAGDASAQFELGLRFADGSDRPRDLKLAAQWFDKAARQNFAKAQYRLATLYEKGLGAPRDLARAVQLYVAAAVQGNTRAMHNLGVLAAENSEARPDYATAALWFAKAAEAGVRDSQYNLAVLLARGLGTPQDLVKAYAWFAIAAAQGDAEAGKRRDELAARLAAADLVAAKATAEAFRPRHVDQAANEALAPRRGADPAAPGGQEKAGMPKLGRPNAGDPKVSGL